MFHVKHVEFGLDYLRVTGNTVDSAGRLYSAGNYEMRWSSHLSNFKEEPASRLGYRGFQRGPLFVGENWEGKTMAQASGPYAGILMGVVRDLNVNCSRIDIQATCWYNQSPTEVLRSVERAAVSMVASLAHRPWALTYIDGHGRGDSFYLGKRSSDLYLRCYDKASESGEDRYAGAVRFEAEYKGSQALQVWEIARQLDEGSLYLLAPLQASFAKRGVPLPVEGVPTIPAPVSLTERSDVTRRLAWFREQVAPTLARLMDDGYGDAALIALGFGDILTSKVIAEIAKNYEA